MAKQKEAFFPSFLTFLALKDNATQDILQSKERFFIP